MRIGNNPAKYGLPAYQPKPLAVATVTYIPEQAGYFNDSFEIFKRMIDSLYANTEQEFDLMVVDNGSCKEVQQGLFEMYQKGFITWLGLSEVNLGKTGALNWIFGSVQNELICYSDSDVYFRKGWWKKTEEILQAFPEAGLVAAQPCFYDIFEGKGSTEPALRKDPCVIIKTYKPEANVVNEYAVALGLTEELTNEYRSMELPLAEKMDSHVQAVIGGTHMQFVTRNPIIKKILPLPVSMGLNRKETRALDYRLDEMGALHLSTLEPYVVHMGNSITPELQSEMKDLPRLEAKARSKQGNKRDAGLSWKRKIIQRISKNKTIRKQLLSLYQSLFDIVFSKEE